MRLCIMIKCVNKIVSKDNSLIQVWLWYLVCINNHDGDFPGGPVVKNPPSNAGDAGSISIGELRSHMPRGNWAPHNYWACAL